MKLPVKQPSTLLSENFQYPKQSNRDIALVRNPAVSVKNYSLPIDR